MGIRFYCPNGHKLHVKAYLAGKRGLCPDCGIRVKIPLETELQSAAPAHLRTNQREGEPGPPNEPDLPLAGNWPVFDERPLAQWYVRTLLGQQFGPATADTMMAWLHKGRVTAEMLVWREDWPKWKRAAEVFPAPQSERPQVPAPPTADTRVALSDSRSPVTAERVEPVGRVGSVALAEPIGRVDSMELAGPIGSVDLVGRRTVRPPRAPRRVLGRPSSAWILILGMISLVLLVILVYMVLPER